MRLSSCGTELQAAQGSAGAEKFASELTYVIVDTWLLSLATKIAPWGCWWRGFPQHAWASWLESQRQCYNLILEAAFHPLCCIPGLGSLQVRWATWQSSSALSSSSWETVLLQSMTHRSPQGSGNPLHSTQVYFPKPCQLCSPWIWLSAKVPPSLLYTPSPPRKWMIGQDPIIRGSDDQPHLWAKPGKQLGNGMLPRSSHYPWVQCLWSTGMS